MEITKDKVTELFCISEVNTRKNGFYFPIRQSK